MPKLVQSEEQAHQWLSDEDVMILLQTAKVGFLPVDRIFFTEKGAICFNDEYQVKAFYWKSKPEHKALSEAATMAFRCYIPVVQGKYPALALGTDGDEAGEYLAESECLYSFFQSKNKNTGVKKAT